MENSLFVFSDKANPIVIERLHICSWEFINNSSLIEFGFEISKSSLNGNALTISLYIPWLDQTCETLDLYDKLRLQENSRFVFNDSVINTISLDGGVNTSGVIQVFALRNSLCILPVSLSLENGGIITANLNLLPYLNSQEQSDANVYFRFSIRPSVPYISLRKKGIGKATIIYDLKINEKRNASPGTISYLGNKSLCSINSCFFFCVVPNKFDIVFIENSSLKNVRTLEYESFNKYLGDKRVKKDELIVFFNKKQNAESFSFFLVYTDERIGPAQYALATLINIICGVLLFVPSYRKSFSPKLSFFQIWKELPLEIWLAIGVAFATLLYFIWPNVKIWVEKRYLWIANWFNKEK